MLSTEFHDVREWLLSIAILAATFAVARLARSALARMRRDGHWAYVKQLAPSIARLIYIVGLRAFAEFAPLNPRWDSWLDSAIYVIAVVLVLSFLRRAAMTAIEWSSFQAKSSMTLQQGFIPLLRNLITLFILFAGAIMILKRFNYDVMSLLTALGVGSLAVGLAAKETLSNMISGFTLIIDSNFRPGDRIDLGGTVGDVEEIGLRSTRIRTGDGNTLIVPNSELVNTKILNLSMPSREITCSTTIRVPYSVPFARVKTLAMATIDEVATSSKRGKWVNLSGLNQGYQTITVGFWIGEMNDSGAALSEFHERLLPKLKAEGIELVPMISGPMA